MRIFALPFLALVLALAPEAHAQLADSSGVYLGLGVGYSNSSGLVGPALAAGYRQQNGLDYGVGVAVGSNVGTQRAFSNAASVGATIGYSADLGRQLALRVETNGAYTYSTLLGSENQRLNSSSLTLDVSSTVSRPVRVAGSFQVAPTIGVYASGFNRLDSYFDDPNAPSEAIGLDAGLQVGLPVSFRLLGTDVTLPFQARFSAAGQSPFLAPGWASTTGIRIGF